MGKFSLDKYLENPSRKVVTRDGRSVRIICTDRKTSNNTNVIGLAKNPYDVEQLLVCNTDGQDVYKEIQNDLFFADEEELTEFEKRFIELIRFWMSGNTNPEENLIQSRFDAKELLDLARKEIRKEEQEKLGTLEMIIDTLNPHYQQGREDALKDLPKWKRNKPNEKYIHNKGYYLTWNELEKLPKEE